MARLVGSEAPEIGPSRVDLPIPATHGGSLQIVSFDVDLVMLTTHLFDFNPTLVISLFFPDAVCCLCLDDAEVPFDMPGAFESRAFARGLYFSCIHTVRHTGGVR